MDLNKGKKEINKIVDSSLHNETEELKKKIINMSNNEYWAIYYFPKKWVELHVKGGGAYVFIARSNGEVIGSILGK